MCSGAVLGRTDLELTKARLISLPPDVIVEQGGSPVLSSDGNTGFVSSVMNGSLLSFNVSSNKVLASVSFGEIAGLVSMMELNGRRIITLPASFTDRGRAPVVNIIDATDPSQLARKALVVLPVDARITPVTRALLTRDGRFGVIASTFGKSALFAFELETGKIVSELGIPGGPAQLSLYDGTSTNQDSLIAVVGVDASSLAIIKLDRSGQLTQRTVFKPHEMKFEVPNNPVFSSDGRLLYVAAAKGEHVFALDTEKGSVLGMMKLASAPYVLSVKREASGIDLLGVTHLGQPPNRKASGVSILSSNKGQLTLKSEFSLPEGIHLSPVSNLLFHPSNPVAYVGTSNGIVFSVSTETGESVGHQIVGGEFRALELSKSGDAVIVVRSTVKTDQIAVFGLKPTAFPQEYASTRDRVVAPQISSVKVDESQQGLVIEGDNFKEGLVVELLRDGKTVSQYSPVTVADKRLLVLLPREKFENLGELGVRLTQISRISSPIVAVDLPRPVAPPASAPVLAVAMKPPVASPATAEPLPSKPSVVRSVTTQLVKGSLHVSVKMDGKPTFRDFTLTEPTRIVVDVIGVTGSATSKTMQVGVGAIERVRVGKPSPGVIRIVIDTKEVVPYAVALESGSLVIQATSNPRTASIATQR